MEYFVLPAMLALLLKLSVIFLARDGQGTSRIFMAMVCIFALHNLTEVLVILGLFSGMASEYMLRVYYAVSFFALAYIGLYALEVSARGQTKFLSYSLVVVALVLAALSLMTNFIVAGAESIGYTITAVRGPYYFVFQAFTVFMYFAAMGILWWGYLRASKQQVQIQCLYSVVAILPMVLASIAVLVIMQLGFHFSAALIIPLASSAFLILTLRSETVHGLTDIGRFLKPSERRLTANIVADLTTQYLSDEVSLKEAKDQFERQLLQHNLDRFGNNVSKTARVLGMKRTTIYSMAKKHGISVQDKES
ncbi:helix-turn-helix domain-containing protein [Arenicella xantha]|uniref:Regulatory Fis family protein n=1 Tax=Arenicella xantha TaxID=644221 RepID=A0A395JS19_9GAMM|nr:helix-turn-helix domain-containing protein [Arenicella xantha]RBP53375.1 regulatory Fis family protein [Arenicella xantha]